MGWYHFDDIADPPNTLDDLTNPQLAVIGDEYTADHNAYEAYVNVLGDPLFAEIQNVKYHVDWVYEAMNRLQTYSAQLMNGQVGENTPPTSEAELVTQLETLIDDPYINGLGPGQKAYGVAEMVAYSKMAGDGDWAYYSAQVTA